MGNHICIDCQRIMEVIKNGFHHLGPDGGVRSGDLWRCYACERFQLHGIPQGQHPWWPLYGLVEGVRVEDPSNEHSLAYLGAKFDFLPPFYVHMEMWYPKIHICKLGAGTY